LRLISSLRVRRVRRLNLCDQLGPCTKLVAYSGEGQADSEGSRTTFRGEGERRPSGPASRGLQTCSSPLGACMATARCVGNGWRIGHTNLSGTSNTFAGRIVSSFIVLFAKDSSRPQYRRQR